METNNEWRTHLEQLEQWATIIPRLNPAEMSTTKHHILHNIMELEKCRAVGGTMQQLEAIERLTRLRQGPIGTNVTGCHDSLSKIFDRCFKDLNSKGSSESMETKVPTLYNEDATSKEADTPSCDDGTDGTDGTLHQVASEENVQYPMRSVVYQRASDEETQPNPIHFFAATMTLKRLRYALHHFKDQRQVEEESFMKEWVRGITVQYELGEILVKLDDDDGVWRLQFEKVEDASSMVADLMGWMQNCREVEWFARREAGEDVLHGYAR